LQQVAKISLPGQTPWAIFVSSIEMANPPTLHAVIFRIGALICAAPAGIVREILPRLPATRIPGVAQAIEGLVNVRGSLLTVLDGHLLLHQERRPEDEGAIVVVEVAGRRYGLGVGQVLDFLEIPDSAVAQRADLPGVDPRLVKAVGLHDAQTFVVLDIDALFAPIIGG
jgi:purine-binding chemotaxis protein CheW